MWLVFSLLVWCWRNSGLLLWHVSLLKPDIARAGLKKYSDVIIFLTVEGFFPRECMVLERFPDRTQKEKSAWVAPSRFSYMRFNIDIS